MKHHAKSDYLIILVNNYSKNIPSYLFNKSWNVKVENLEILLIYKLIKLCFMNLTLVTLSRPYFEFQYETLYTFLNQKNVCPALVVNFEREMQK